MRHLENLHLNCIGIGGVVSIYAFTNSGRLIEANNLPLLSCEIRQSKAQYQTFNCLGLNVMRSKEDAENWIYHQIEFLETIITEYLY